jgi:P-type Mg2+ transporter
VVSAQGGGLRRDARDRSVGTSPSLDVREAAAMSLAEALGGVDSSPTGLTSTDANLRLEAIGPNAVRSRRTRAWEILARQVRSPLLLLLAVTAGASYFLGERTDAVIIGLILALSVGLGFVNEYHAAQVAESLHAKIRHYATAWRDGNPQSVDVTHLVPGDVVDIRIGEVVPADIRLLSVDSLECDESVLTGESVPIEKHLGDVSASAELAELTNCGLMGTVVQSGAARGVVIATGASAQFGRIAAGLESRQPETEFQAGLRQFSKLLVQVASVLTVSIFVINLAEHRPFLDALLFSLAIAVGITPQLLPAVVSTSLAAGSRQLARRKVLVKRLICIEDLGDVDVLFTDKTGTLTEGQISFMRAIGPTGTESSDPTLLGLLCNEAAVSAGHAVGGNTLDLALWASPSTAALLSHIATYQRIATLPFDHERRMSSVLVMGADGVTTQITKGAPEDVLARCTDVGENLKSALSREFDGGSRVVAVATKPRPGATGLTANDERDMSIAGLLVFLDPPKTSAAAALRRLNGLGITVKIVTGDNAAVARKVCSDLGLAVGRTVTGHELDAIDDDALPDIIRETAIFARVSPEQKARIVRAQRTLGVDVAFLGDGVNDALALHAADIGVSVESATDVAKDAADVVLLEKDLDVLADGVSEGRRIFANTIKYVLMGTSSNFGNMFSAALASAFLPFLPMLPSQILLNNLLYDCSQLAIPTDNVDEEQVERPTRWDIGFVRRFMLFFGPISSVFDFATFGIMLWVFHAGPALFRSGWFVESLATQTLVIFAIRTRRIPFFRSRPSLPLLLSAFSVVTIGAILPETPLANSLGFASLPGRFFAALVVLVALYLVLIEIGKAWFYRLAAGAGGFTSEGTRTRQPGHRIQRRAARFTTTHHRLRPGPGS